MEKQINENWALSQRRIKEFFLAQKDVQPHDDDFTYKSCIVSFEPCPAEDKPFAPERTRISFSGEAADVEEIHRRFFLRFLSAGG